MVLDVEGEEQPPASPSVPKEGFAHCGKQVSSGAESNSFPKGKNQLLPSAQMTHHIAAAISAIPEQNHFGVPPAYTTPY